MANYCCAFCNRVFDSRDSRRYVYASSTKNVKVYVCSSCHGEKMKEMAEYAKKHLGKKMVLGVLRAKPPSFTTPDPAE